MYLAGGISTTDYNMYVIRCFIILHKYVSNVCICMNVRAICRHVSMFKYVTMYMDMCKYLCGYLYIYLYIYLYT